MRTISKKRYLSSALEAKAENDFIADKIKKDKDEKEAAQKDGKTTKDDKDGNGKDDKPGVDKDGKFVKAGSKADVEDDKKDKKDKKPATEEFPPSNFEGRGDNVPGDSVGGRTPAAPAEPATPVEGGDRPAAEPAGDVPPAADVPPATDTPTDGETPPVEPAPEGDLPPADGPQPNEADPETPPETDVQPGAEPEPAPAARTPEGDRPAAEPAPAEEPPVDAAAAGSPTDDVPPTGDIPPGPDAPVDGVPPVEGDLPPTDLGDVPPPADGAETPPEGGEPEPEADPTVADDVEGELLEAADIEVGLDENERKVDDGMEAVRALESLYVSLEAGRQLGGVDKIGGEIAMNQVNFFSRQLGIPVKSKFPALEDFNNYKSRLRANNITLEGLREFIEKVWAGIRDAVLKSVAWFKSWYQKAFAAAKGMATRAAALLSKEGAADSAQAKPIDNEQLAARLQINGKVPGDASGSQILLDVTNGVLGNFDDHVGACESIADVFKKIAPGTSLEATATSLGENLKLYNGKMLGLDLVNNPAAEGFEELPAGVQLWRSKELPGGQAVLLRALVEVNNETINKIGGAMGEFKENRSEFVGKDVPVLGREEARKAAQNILDACQALDKIQNLVARASKAKETVADQASKIAKMDFDESSKEAMGRFQAAAGGLTKFMDQPFAAYVAYMLTAGRALLTQVDLSLGGSGGEKPAEAPAK